MTNRSGIPENHEIAAEQDPVRSALLSAIQRVLLNHPKRISPGAPRTIGNLALEAGVGRHNLYQSHVDLKDRFEFLRDKGAEPTSEERALTKKLERAAAEIDRITALQARTHELAQNWKALSETLQRAINVLQEELRREQTKSERLSRKLEANQSQSVATLIPIRKPK